MEMERAVLCLRNLCLKTAVVWVQGRGKMWESVEVENTCNEWREESDGKGGQVWQGRAGTVFWSLGKLQGGLGSTAQHSTAHPKMLSRAEQSRASGRLIEIVCHARRAVCKLASCPSILAAYDVTVVTIHLFRLIFAAHSDDRTLCPRPTWQRQLCGSAGGHEKSR